MSWGRGPLQQREAPAVTAAPGRERAHCLPSASSQGVGLGYTVTGTFKSPFRRNARGPEPLERRGQERTSRSFRSKSKRPSARRVGPQAAASCPAAPRREGRASGRAGSRATRGGLGAVLGGRTACLLHVSLYPHAGPRPCAPAARRCRWTPLAAPRGESRQCGSRQGHRSALRRACVKVHETETCFAVPRSPRSWPGRPALLGTLVLGVRCLYTPGTQGAGKARPTSACAVCVRVGAVSTVCPTLARTAHVSRL